jgi:CDP-diacylglycerol---serine O-phosphatidyltransferase
MKKGIISHVPNMFTLLNAGFGIMAIIMAFESVEKSLVFLVLAMIADFFDGWVARKYKVTTELGKQLDSLADAISFVVAPAVLSYLYFFEIWWLAAASAIFIAGCGILRLATFNIKGGTDHFVGMPTPLFTVFLIGLIFSKAPIHSWAYGLLIFLGAFLMISPIPYPSFKGKKEVKFKYLGALCIGLIFIATAFFSGYNFIIAEYTILLVLLGLPILLNKNFRNLELGFFGAGLVVLIFVFYSSLTTLALLPLFYGALALPLIEKSRS